MEDKIIQMMEVLETKPLSELATEAVIKVCWVDDVEKNRNNVIITREVGKEIASSLPGAPVVGFFNESIQDFEGHKQKIIIENDEVTFQSMTRPYGFVNPMEKPWFQDFEEDGKIRTYLMCKAILWTRQYLEANLALDKGQSMELNEDSIDGYYRSIDEIGEQTEVFVFTSAILDKLCILGKDYEPCFKGAGISKNFTLEIDNFAKYVSKLFGKNYSLNKDTYEVIEIEKENVDREGAVKMKDTSSPCKYGVSLSWNIYQAIADQLVERGAGEKYKIEDVFLEEDGDFYVILQDVSSLRYLKCYLTISGDSVALDLTMSGVTKVWQEDGSSDTSEAKGENIKTNRERDNTVEEKVNLSNFSRIKGEDEKINGGEQILKDQEKRIEETNEVSAEYEVATNNSEQVVEDAQKAEVSVDENAVDFEAQVFELRQELEAQKALVEQLEKRISEYEVLENKMKDELIASYESVLTKEEFDIISEGKSEYSLERLEEKIAVIYMRKNKDKVQFQLNVDQIDSDADSSLPDFMKTALEYDRKNYGI